MTPILHSHTDISAFSTDAILHILLDAVLDTFKTLPFLFIAFLNINTLIQEYVIIEIILSTFRLKK